MTADSTSGSATRQTRVTVPPSSVAVPHGSGPSAGSTSGQGSSVLSEKIGERLWRVARVRSRRSCLGPGSVRSWGSTCPVSKSSTRTRARMPWRVSARAIGPGVVLGHRPDRRLGVVDQRARLSPLLDRPRRSLVGVALGLLRPALPIRFGQVDRDRVVGGALEQRRPLLEVDHVVGRRRHVVERADHVEVVVQGVDRAHVCHRRES